VPPTLPGVARVPVALRLAAGCHAGTWRCCMPAVGYGWTGCVHIAHSPTARHTHQGGRISICSNHAGAALEAIAWMSRRSAGGDGGMEGGSRRQGEAGSSERPSKLQRGTGHADASGAAEQAEQAAMARWIAMSEDTLTAELNALRCGHLGRAR
jgi:hypothetical protein